MQKDINDNSLEETSIQVGTNYIAPAFFFPDPDPNTIKINFTQDFPDGISGESLDLLESLTEVEQYFWSNDVDTEGIRENLNRLDVAIEKISGTRANLGAVQSRLNSTIATISSGIENMSAANSGIRDVDYAEESSKFTQSRILTQAGLSILTQANQKAEMVLNLLR